MDAKLVIEAWEALIGTTVIGVGFVAWLIRLESKYMVLEKVQETQDKSIITAYSKFDGVQATLNSLLQSFGRLEGKIDAGSSRSHNHLT